VTAPPPAPAPVALVVQLTGATARRPFLLEGVAGLVPGTAAAAAYADRGDGAIELLIDRPHAGRFTSWMTAMVSAGHVASVRAARGRTDRSDGLFDDPVERDRYRRHSYQLSGRALDLLARHPGGIPPSMAAAELWRVHRRSASPVRTAHWHVAWLRALVGGGPWPDATDDVAAWWSRLAHGQWLRLTGGVPHPAGEIDALEALIEARAEGPGRRRPGRPD
jgi:hypothetical protein